MILEDIQYNIDTLSQYVERNIPILFSEPSCGLAVKSEYPRIIESPQAQAVADNSYDIHHYLWQMHQNGELKTDFGRLDMRVGYHAPCHLKSLGVSEEPIQLMELIPGLTVERFSDKCCGMGGTYGLKSKNFELSMKIGQRLFEEISASSSDQLVTGCGACGMQIHQGTMRESIHPLKLLSQAYQEERAASSVA